MATYETQGTVLARGDGASPEVFTDIPQLTSIDPVGFQRSLIDVTDLLSEAREYKLALKDGQEINCEAWYDPDDTTQAGLRDDLNDGITRNFTLTLTDSPPQVITFQALVMNWSLGAQIDNVYPLRFTLKPTGDMIFT